MLRQRLKKQKQPDISKNSKDEETSLAKLLLNIGIWFCCFGLAFYLVYEFNKPPQGSPVIVFQEVQKHDSVEKSVINTPPTNEIAETSACEWQEVEGATEDDAYPGWCEGMKKIPAESAEDCKAKCCEAGEDCAKWQYRDDDLGCRHREDLGGYCDKEAPQPWTGFKLKSRQDGNCEWETKEQKGQCMGFGPRKKAFNSAEECRQACCDTTEPKACSMWQWRVDAGCFFGRSSYCQTMTEKSAFDPFKGGRKVGYVQTGRIG